MSREKSYEEKQELLDEILKFYQDRPDKKEQAVVKEMLGEIQEVYGCLPSWSIKKAAAAAGVNESFIQILLRTSPNLKAAPYTHEILFCTGERCAKKGSLELLCIVKKELQIGKDGISKDGKTYLKTQNCLKHCRTAPNLMIDGKLSAGYSPEDMAVLLTKMFR